MNIEEGRKLVNIDTTHKLFVWSFPKTGSNLFMKVFEGYNHFKCFSTNGRDLKIFEPSLVYHRDITLFPNYEHHKPIITLRNPYSLMVSLYNSDAGSFHHETKKKDFTDWLEKGFFKNSNIDNFLENILKIDDFYPLRFESLKKDYHNLPNIEQTNSFRYGRLNEILDSVVNSNEYVSNFKEYYQKNTADLIYYSFVNYFRIFEYDKNSWK